MISGQWSVHLWPGNCSDDFQRDTLVCNMLSYVDFYKPDYFLLENVWGMVHHKIQGRDSEVAMAVIKFINRGLTSIGCVSFHSALALTSISQTAYAQLSSPFQSPPSRPLRVPAGQAARHLLGCTARASASRIPGADAPLRAENGDYETCQWEDAVACDSHR